MKNESAARSGRVNFQQVVSIGSLSDSSLPEQAEAITITTGSIQSADLTSESIGKPVAPAMSRTERSVDKEDSESTAIPAGQDGRLYRIDSKHEKFQPSRRLSEPGLHLSVKTAPAAQSVGIEQVIREKRAIRISKGNEVQQIVVSTYEAVADTDEIDDIGLDVESILSDGSTLVDLPRWKTVDPVNRAEDSPSPVPLPETPVETQTSQDIESADDSGVETEPIEFVEETKQADERQSVDSHTESRPTDSTGESENELASEVDSETRVDITNNPVREIKTDWEVKPAWEVVAFRWPATIRKLCSEHRRAFQRLLDSLQQNQNNSLARIGVIHAVPGQGATTLATCMAKILAESGLHVLLTDLDLERPGVEEIANIQLKHGWQELLNSEQSINEYLVRDSSENLTLMPLSKQFDLVANRPRLLEKIKEISTHVSRHFDYSIVDIGNVQNLMIEEKCHVGFLDGVVIVSDSTGFDSTAVSIYEKLVAAGVPSVVIAENFRNQSRSAA